MTVSAATWLGGADMNARALAVFTVKHNSVRIRVRLVAGQPEVEHECKRAEGRKRRRAGLITRACFMPTWRGKPLHVGTIVLPADGHLCELIPHEVVHAALYHFGTADTLDDEDLATHVGMLCSRITARLRRLGVEV